MSSSHHKPNWLGKPAAEMRADAAHHRDQQPIHQHCLFCRWHWIGLVAEGRTEARTHREQHHPEAVGRKTYRKPRGYQVGVPINDEVIDHQRRARLEREEADQLATIERGHIRREQAA